LKAALAEPDTLKDALAGLTLESAAEDPNVRKLIQRLESMPAASSSDRGFVMIAITCSSCQKKLSIKEEAAGKRVKCPGCGAVMPVPAKTKAAAPVAGPAPAAEMATMPPQVSASECPTHNPSSVGERTEGIRPTTSESEHDNSLTDFLTPPQTPDELGRLGKYRILKILGHGGMGVVYKAEDPKLKRLVAIKAMLPTLAASASAGKRFLREAEAMAKLEHDHVVRVYQVDEDRGVPYLAMEFLKGEPLDVRLHRGEKMPASEIMRIGREIAEALAAAHAQDLVHRDIKPGNIWIEEPRGRVKILDFGLARATSQDSGLTQQGAIVGTPAYMAPEQARGDTVDARCDLWALGVVLYRLCTGKQPFVGKDTVSTLMAVAMQEPQPPHELDAEISAELSNLVMQLLEKDPEKRISKAEDVVACIRKMEKDWARAHDEDSRTLFTTAAPKGANTAIVAGPTTQQPKAPTTIAPPPRRRYGLLVGLACGLLALVAGAVVFFLQTPHGTVRVEINDPKIKVAINGEELTFDGADSKTLSVKAGQTGLTVKRDDFSFDTTKFELKKGETVTLKIDWIAEGKVQVALDGKVIAEKRLEPVIIPVAQGGGHFALDLEDAGAIEIPTLKLQDIGDTTVEAWVKIDPQPSNFFPNPHFLGQGGYLRFHVDRAAREIKATAARAPTNVQFASAPLPPADRWFHIAATRSNAKIALFVNGKKVGDTKGNPKREPNDYFIIGGGKGMRSTEIDEVRVSKGMRYESDFTPAKRFDADADTLALWHMDEGQGDVLKDSSGNGHHGKIVGAKWVTVESTSIPVFDRNYALQFDGEQAQAIVIANVLPEPPTALTIEAYASAPRLSQQSTIVRMGWLEFNRSNNDRWTSNVIGANGSFAWKEAIANERTHLATVLENGEVRFYVNGKLAGAEKAKLPSTAKFSPYLRIGGASYKGTISEVRVSRSARYRSDFTPIPRFHPDKDTVALYHMDEGQGDVLTDSSGNNHHGKIAGAKWVKADGALVAPPTESHKRALLFDGESTVELGAIPLDTKRAYTLEAWATRDANWQRGGSWLVAVRGTKLGTNSVGQYWGGSLGKVAIGSSSKKINVGRPTHVATVFTGSEILLFIDGLLIGRQKFDPGARAEDKGPGQLGGNWFGTVREVRISQVARYDKDFTPAQRFEPDADTLALYHMDEGEGDVLKDSSGNGHHGKIVGAKWVSADGTPLEKSSPNFSLEFDGQTSEVQIPTLKYDGEHPLTVEGFFISYEHRMLPQSIVSLAGTEQFTLSRSGTNQEKGWRASITKQERFRGWYTSEEANLFKRTHVAAVYKDGVAKLFIDGRLAKCKTGPPVVSIKGGSITVLGHSGNYDPKTRALQEPKYFAGAMDEVRISKVARYDKDFTPAQRFEPDADTLALYHMDEGESDVLRDSSGNGHHGKIVGAKWVKEGRAAKAAMPNPAERWTLDFDGNSSYVAFPSLKIAADANVRKVQAHTIEAWLQLPDRALVRPEIIAVLGGPNQASFLYMHDNKIGVSLTGFSPHIHGYILGNLDTQPPGRLFHIAATWDGDQTHVFLDGRKKQSFRPREIPDKFLGQFESSLGAVFIRDADGKRNPGRDFFRGRIAMVRYSKAARYDKDFSPERRFESDPDTLALYRFDEGQGDVLTDSSGNGHHGKIVGAKWVKAGADTPRPPALPVGSAGLEFDGARSHVLLPGLTVPEGEILIEGWFTLAEGAKSMSICTLPRKDGDGLVRLTVLDSKPSTALVYGSKNSVTSEQGSASPVGKKFHLAVGVSNNAWSYWLDGKKIMKGAATGGWNPPIQGLFPGILGRDPNLDFGAIRGRPPFQGIIHALCISKKVPVYSEKLPNKVEFTPKERLQADPDTLALYHMDEGQGDVLTDSSGNGHHGKIVGAKWVKVEGPPVVAPAKPSKRLAFDGATEVIVPKMPITFEVPYTWEAYATPTKLPQANAERMTVLIRPNAPGLNIHVKTLPSCGFFFSNKSPVLGGSLPKVNERQHVAGVLTADEAILFVNGKVINRAKLHEKPSISAQGNVLIGSKFVGTLEEIRISKVARYNTDFTPAKRFEPDVDTLALYHCDEGQGDVLNDSSGNGHHGKIVGAKWVKADGAVEPAK
jgi:serine/threonine protein kinase